ncbi:hypothetical protein D3C71_1421760 [compost metagenome]
MQVVASGLLDGLGLILADTAGQVGDAVLLLALHLHPLAIDGLKAGGRCHRWKHQHACSGEGQQECMEVFHDDDSRVLRNPIVTSFGFPVAGRGFRLIWPEYETYYAICSSALARI